MSKIAEALSRAELLHYSGERERAEAVYREVLEMDPRQEDALHLLGVIAHQQGKNDEAIDLMRRSIELAPDKAAFHSNLGLIYKGVGRLEDAERSLREALRLHPDLPEAHNNLGITLHDQGKYEEAIASFRRALQLRPENAEALNNLGNALTFQGKLEQARAYFQDSLQVRPGYADVFNNLGTNFERQGNLQEAELQFRTALNFKPAFAEAHGNLATVLKAQGKLDEAEEHAREALQLRPKHAPAHINLGGVFLLQCKLDEAMASYREALRCSPGFAPAGSDLLFCMNYDHRMSAEDLFSAHHRWGERYDDVEGAGPAQDHDRNPERRLRVGYVSQDLIVHPISYFLTPILRNRDREQVETICYSAGTAVDAMTARLRSMSDGWKEIYNLTDIQAADLIRSDRIDILVDLAGYTGRNRLGVFTYKPAPVQVTYLGYPHSTGLKAIDYRLTDAVADPPGSAADSTEELIRLPGGFCCYLPHPLAPEVGPLPALTKGHITFGSMHSLSKLNENVLQLWCSVLHALPTAHLFIFRHTLQGKIKEELRNRLVMAGIEEERIDLHSSLGSEATYLSQYHHVDISLDVFPWGGHTTACESLWMGVPVVTLRGSRHASRMVASVLTQAGLSEWIADTPDQYIDLAVELGRNPEKLAETRDQLREKVRNSPLCDGEEFTRGLEATYRDLWRRWCTREDART